VLSGYPATVVTDAPTGWTGWKQLPQAQVR